MEVTGGRLLQLLAAAEVLQQGGSTGGNSDLSRTLSKCRIAFMALSAGGPGVFHIQSMHKCTSPRSMALRGDCANDKVTCWHHSGDASLAREG